MSEEPRVTPFSNATHFDGWVGDNCEVCARSTFYAGPGRGKECPLEQAVLDAICGDGSIPRPIADRMGVPEGWVHWRCREFEPIPIANADPSLSAPVRGDRTDLSGQQRLFEGDDA